ncbi:hypothetical protein DVH24_000751 [Malus domestica]|uniref:Pentacotripeptide-repeat region of PRORP domain-containing protein n=1 Tax=Malus domestica TaxID=3750 RepID=A0A498JZJ3_MALDO|nr:hypothetical protein DVH24_000751 [Malus domestica]
MIKAFAKRSSFRSAFELFRRLREEALCPYNFTYPFVLKPLDAWERFGKVKGSRFEEALDMFRRMSCESNEKPDEATAGELVMGIQYNSFNEEVALFQEMQTKRVKGDKFTAAALLTGCAPLGALEQGEWIHGCWYRGYRSVCKMLEHRQIFWASIIYGVARNGKTSKGIELFSKMVQIGMKLDDFTFIVVLTDCVHRGLVDEGCEFFNSNRKIYEIERGPKMSKYDANNLVPQENMDICKAYNN